MQIQFDFIAKLKKDLIKLELQLADIEDLLLQTRTCEQHPVKSSSNDNEDVSLSVFDHISRRKQFIFN